MSVPPYIQHPPPSYAPPLPDWWGPPPSGWAYGWHREIGTWTTYPLPQHQGSAPPPGDDPPADRDCRRAPTPVAGDGVPVERNAANGRPVQPGAFIARALGTKGLDLEAVRERDLQGYDARLGGKAAHEMRDGEFARPGGRSDVTTAPSAVSLVGRATVRKDGVWDTKRPGVYGLEGNPTTAAFANAVPRAAALHVLPGGVLPDGEGKQADHSPDRFTVLLYDGKQACTVDAAAEVVWGDWNPSLGFGVGGPVLRPTGTAGELNLDILGRDADGNERSDFRLNLHGDLRFGSVGDVVLRRPAADTLEIEADVVRPATAGDALGETGREWDVYSAARYVAQRTDSYDNLDGTQIGAHEETIVMTDPWSPIFKPSIEMPAGATAGRRITIVNKGSTAMDIDGRGEHDIEGSTGYNVPPGRRVTLEFENGNWRIIALYDA